jgi:hypothetical protein
VSKLHNLQKKNKKWFRSSLLPRFLGSHLSSLDLLRTEVRQGEEGGGEDAKWETRRGMHKASSWSTCYNMHLTRTHLSIRSLDGETERSGCCSGQGDGRCEDCDKSLNPRSCRCCCLRQRSPSLSTLFGRRAGGQTDEPTNQRTDGRPPEKDQRTDGRMNRRTSAPYLYVYVYVYSYAYLPQKIQLGENLMIFQFLIANLFINCQIIS